MADPLENAYILTSLATSPSPDIALDLTDVQKENFPKTPGPITEVWKNNRSIQGLASKIMSFWRINLKLKMGQGTFDIWDHFKVG